VVAGDGADVVDCVEVVVDVGAMVETGAALLPEPQPAATRGRRETRTRARAIADDGLGRTLKRA
jgi:hypothetical protein